MNGYYINSHCCPKQLVIDNFELRSVSGSYHLVIRVGNILYTNFKPLYISASKFPLN